MPHLFGAIIGIIIGGVIMGAILLIVEIFKAIDKALFKPRRDAETRRAAQRQADEELRTAVREAEQLGLIDPTSDHPALKPLGYPKTTQEGQHQPKQLTYRRIEYPASDSR